MKWENDEGKLRELFQEIPHIGEGNDMETLSVVDEVAEGGS